MRCKTITAGQVVDTGEIRLFHANLPEQCMKIDSYADARNGEIQIWIESQDGKTVIVLIPLNFDEWDIWSAEISKRDLRVALIAAAERQEGSE